MEPSEALAILHRHGLRPPRVLTLAITGACNLSCRHCWVEAGGLEASLHLQERTGRRLIQEFRDLGGIRVRLTGGEPLCHPAWLRLLEFCRSAGLEDVALQTNATLFDRDTVAALRELKFRQLAIQVSLDGAVAPTHDQVRGAGAFDRALRGLDLLVQGGLADGLSIFFTEMRHNLREIPALLELARRIGVGSVVTGALVTHGRATASGLEPPLPEQYLNIVEHFKADARFRELYQEIGTVAALEWQRESLPRTEGCTFAENPYLTSSGRLYPCVLCPADEYAVDGLAGRGLAAVLAGAAPRWAALADISRARSAHLASCRDCAGSSFCAGGCMGRAIAAGNGPLAADDRCASRRVIYSLRDYPSL